MPAVTKSSTTENTMVAINSSKIVKPLARFLDCADRLVIDSVPQLQPIGGGAIYVCPLLGQHKLVAGPHNGQAKYWLVLRIQTIRSHRAIVVRGRLYVTRGTGNTERFDHAKHRIWIGGCLVL